MIERQRFKMTKGHSGGIPMLNQAEDPKALNQLDFFKVYGSIPCKSFFKLNEVLELLQVRPYVLRFWETEFEQIKTTKSPSGQVIYRYEDVVILLMVKKFLLDEKLPIENARLKLDQELRSTNFTVLAKFDEESCVATPSTPSIPSIEESSDELNKLLSFDSISQHNFVEETLMEEEVAPFIQQSVQHQEDFPVDDLFSTMAMETFEEESNSTGLNSNGLCIEVIQKEESPVVDLSQWRELKDSLELISFDLKSIKNRFKDYLEI
jgi:DNA-binding transcriptional MerR regulator